MQYIDEVYEDLNELIRSDLGTPSADCSNRDDLLIWLHYRARMISSRPRKVIYSESIQNLRAEYPTIDLIASVLRSGGDVSPWLSERIRNRRSDFKADLMFNDWQISHLHLGRIFESPAKVKRSQPLLFAHIKADRATFLDVQPHGAWGQQRLLRILRETSPDDLPELVGIVASPEGGVTDKQLLSARQHGSNPSIQIDGKVFFSPGFGLSSSRHAARISIFADQFARSLAKVRAGLSENSLPPHLRFSLAATMGVPIRLGLTIEAGCITFFDKTRGIRFWTLRPLE